MVNRDPKPSSPEDRVVELKRQLDELKRRFPAHSLTPALMQQLDELEEALADALAGRELADTDPSESDERLLTGWQEAVG